MTLSVLLTPMSENTSLTKSLGHKECSKARYGQRAYDFFVAITRYNVNILLQVRILVTHGIGFLPQCDVIVVMADGQITEIGSYTELLENNRAFAQFLQTYKGVDEKEEETPGIFDTNLAYQ